MELNTLYLMIMVVLRKPSKKPLPVLCGACQAHFERNILSSVSDKHRIHLRHQLRDMFNAPSEEEARRRKDLITQNHSGKTFEKAMNYLENGFDEACVVYGLPVHQKSRCAPLTL